MLSDFVNTPMVPITFLHTITLYTKYDLVRWICDFRCYDYKVLSHEMNLILGDKDRFFTWSENIV